MIEDHLAQAQGHLSIGEQVIARQRRVISPLERDGHDSEEAPGLLALFEPRRRGRCSAFGVRNSRLLNEQVLKPSGIIKFCTFDGLQAERRPGEGPRGRRRPCDRLRRAPSSATSDISDLASSTSIWYLFKVTT
jgi:hypothetical protein